ncbi:MAG TPA: hypothetical protein VER55_00115 [Ardenticatenaceae bacterium]|nr:hypothetical protein [Ardenticatenaceae bacterium]
MSGLTTIADQVKYDVEAIVKAALVASVHINVGQDLIYITEDKVRLRLEEHLEVMERRSAWMVPAGIFVTLLVIFPTATFHDWILSKEVWEAAFLIGVVLSGAWLLAALRHIRTSSSVDTIIAEIKQGGVSVSAPRLILPSTASGVSNDEAR